MANKIGRNQSCPCGSGIKYKKCCLAKKPTYAQQQNIRRILDEFAEKNKEEEGAKKVISVDIDKSQSAERAID